MIIIALFYNRLVPIAKERSYFSVVSFMVDLKSLTAEAMNRRKARKHRSWNKDRAFNEVQSIIESKKYAAKTAEVEVVREA